MKTNELKLFMGNSNLSLADAMKKIDENANGILFINNDKGELSGSITDGDIRRWLIKTGKIDTTIEYIMNKNPKYLFVNEKSNAKIYMNKNKIKVLPIIDKSMHVIDLYLNSLQSYKIQDFGDRFSLKDNNVIIMAGGKGTRLYPFTKILPKPLIPIGDIPIIERIINRFCDYGISNYYITVNYKKEMIKSYFNEISPTYKLHYIEEDKPLGTAGSIRLIKENFKDPIIIVNCDILIDADYSKIMDYHNKSGNVVTIISALKNIVVPYGILNMKESGIVTSIDEKPRLSYFINTGMYVLNPELICEIPNDTFFHMTDLIEKFILEGKKVGMYPVSEDAFLDMGEIEEMKRMEEKLKV